MAKFFAIACLMLAAGYVYIRQSSERRAAGPAAFRQEAAAPDAAAAAGAGVSGFVGNSGYLLQFPDSYDAVPEMDGPQERVYFFPKGAELTRDESLFKQRRIVRLEVSPLKMGDMRIDLAAVKQGVTRTLDQNRETYTIREVNLGLPGFQAEITKPMKLKQLFLQGSEVLYVFTGNDEELMHGLARSLKDVLKQP